MKNTKVTRKIAAFLAAVMAMTTMATIGASADNNVLCSGEAITSCYNNFNEEMAERSRKQLCETRQRQLEWLYNKRITINIENYGFYTAKNIKLYGRKAVGVDHDGNFILGKWEEMKSITSLNGGISFTDSGEYVAFAFSYDVLWGTDFPFSGIFWDKAECTSWDKIDIRLTGTCRMAGVNFYMGDKKVLSQSNGSAHKEWKP